MSEDFEDQLRAAIHSDDVEIRSDTEQAIRTGRRIVRGRRLGWGLAASAVVVAAALVVPGMLQPTLPAVPAETVLATPSPPPATLIGTRWEVLKLDGADLIPGTSITLAFGEGRVDGFGGCNQYGYGEVDGKAVAGWYRQDGDRLAIGSPAANAKGCIDGIGEQESRYFEALTSVQRFVLAGDSLQLFGADDTVLVELLSDLEFTGWRITSLGGAPVAADPEQTIVFHDGQVGFNDGCNGSSGPYEQDGLRLSTSLVITTLKACGGRDHEFRPEEVRSFRRDGERLTLLDVDGVVLLEATHDASLLLRRGWVLDNDEGQWGTREKTGITLAIGAESVNGNSGCGVYNATLRTDGRNWKVSGVERVSVPCTQAAAQRAERFLTLLAQATTVEFWTTQLRLITPTETLYFTRT